MNIVLDCERMKYPDTGIYHYCLNLGRHLQATLDTNSERLTYFAPESAREPLGNKSNFILQNSLQKFWMPQLGDYHLWHSTYQSSAYLPRRNKKLKVLLTIHDLNFIYEKKSAAKQKKYLRHLQDNIDRSDAIVCISEFCRNDVLTYCRTGNKPVYIIHNGTNSLNEPTLHATSYKPLRRFLFSIGVVTKKKNFHSLLPLLQQDSEIELLIAGKHDNSGYVDHIMDSAREMGVEKNLRLLGAVTEEEKAWYYKNCYAYTSASVAEGFGMPVTEAMAFGKPLFLSDKTALPEIGGNVAFYFRDFTPVKMREVFDDGMKMYHRDNMEEAIKQRGLSFCWQKAARSYLDIYRSLL